MNDKTKDAVTQKLSLQSAVPAAEKLRQLKQLFPEAFAENQTLDFERLQNALAEFSESTGQTRERYGLSWPGKAECMKIIQQASTATLRPDRKQSARFDTTQNLFIEGDNLEALKLLQKAYYGKVKSITIDPPYNTGKDFVYRDNWKTPLKEYLRQTGQLDENGKRIQTAETNGRKHSRWLSMMYPRLYLARQLLASNGAIFISIDDHENHNLRHLLDEIFGQENFIAQFVWKKKGGASNTETIIGCITEQVICYAKDIDELQINRRIIESATYPHSDKKGKFRLQPLTKTDAGDYNRPTMKFGVPVPKSDDLVYPPDGQRWTVGKPKMTKMLRDNLLHFQKTENGWRVRMKDYYDPENPQTGVYLNLMLEHGSMGSAKTELVELGFGREVADTPKPVRLVEHLLRLSTSPKSKSSGASIDSDSQSKAGQSSDEGDIVLDFFAGSCTTAHAVMKLNKEDGGNRRFIMVQLPEKYPENSEAFKAGYKTIADVGKERIRRAANQLNDQSGFKVFRLDESNFKAWDNTPAKNVKELQKRLEMHVNHLDPESSKEDILYEILLKAGHPLTTHIEKKEMAGTKIYSVDNGKLFLCLEKITLKAVHAMAKAEPQEVICLDSCFAGNDELKTNAYYYFKCRSTVPGDYPEILFRTV